MMRVALVLVLLAGWPLTGCGRPSITFALGADNGRLEEATVMGEDGWGTRKVALIDVRGLIVDAPRPGVLQAPVNPVDEFVARLERAREDDGVRAVVVRINSPGGSVSASDTMYRELERFRVESGKPVVVSMGEVAASGGYYLALAADEIVAQPTTITASIGVIMPTLNVSEGLRRWGITSRAVKSGANKDLANPLEPVREDHYLVLQGMVDEFYGRFRGLALEKRVPRGFDRARADELMDGRVVTGSQAVAAGLVDGEGTLRDAFERAKALAGLDEARLVKYHAWGERPKSAYAVGGDQPVWAAGGAGDAGGREINLLQINLGGPEAGAGAYYLWTLSP